MYYPGLDHVDQDLANTLDHILVQSRDQGLTQDQEANQEIDQNPGK